MFQGASRAVRWIIFGENGSYADLMLAQFPPLKIAIIYTLIFIRIVIRKVRRALSLNSLVRLLEGWN